jgi:hypothetical protein
MSPAQLRGQANRLRALPLPAVLRAAGAVADAHDKARWHTTAGTVSVTGTKFFNWNRCVGGGGAIDLVIHLYGLDFKEAIAWLRGHFPHGAPAPSLPAAAPRPNLSLPAACTAALPIVKRYLTGSRRVGSATVDRLIHNGNLYADVHHNAVFVLRGQRNVAVGAELRGTGPRPWRGMAPGSRKNSGYFSIRDTHIEAVVLCESAIDAISCHQLQPHRWCISTAGARPNPAWLPPFIRRGLPVFCGFDADSTGDAMANAMIARYPAITRLRPPRQDWNDLLRSLP